MAACTPGVHPAMPARAARAAHAALTGNHGGVAGVVLGDILLHLAHQVGAHVGGLQATGKEAGHA